MILHFVVCTIILLLCVSMASSSKRTLTCYFVPLSKKPRISPRNEVAEELAKRLGTSVKYLTKDANSWYLLKGGWWLPSSEEFSAEWDLHPKQRHKLKLFGREVEEKRWSQSWGVSYSYSGSTNVAKPFSESSNVTTALIQQANELTKDVINCEVTSPYNGCLQNWYQPEDTIGLHSDDESSQRKECPIFSLSWGGTRRFLFRSRDDKKHKTEIFLKDGDLLVMGGTCQETHQHEVPKRRVTMDPESSNRINWTIRAFKTK